MNIISSKTQGDINIVNDILSFIFFVSLLLRHFILLSQKSSL